MKFVLATALIALSAHAAAQVVYVPDFPVQKEKVSTATTETAPSNKAINEKDKA